MPIEERLRIYRLLTEHQDWVDTLKEALEVERANVETEYWLGWEWHEVHTQPQVLNKMVAERLVNITFSSRSSTHYKVRSPELVEEAIKALTEPVVEEKPQEIPQDLFSIIVGHENVKTILRYAIDSEKEAHVLMSGPPASAKTLFLMELLRLPNSYYALAPALTAAGLADLLFTYEPQYLLIDEIDRLSGDNLGVLNSLLATGHIVETKYKRIRQPYKLSTKVFAAGIRVDLLPKDLLSRFIKLKFKPYSEQEFVQVSTTVMTTMEGILPHSAERIARAVWGMSRETSDVRQCVQIARLSGGDDSKIDEVITVLKQYGLRIP
jgi:Holliday junction DNA helicase RuvB